MKSRKVKLADVFWKAANRKLWAGGGSRNGSWYSCFAVADALGVDTGDFLDSGKHPARLFMNSLGCSDSSDKVWGLLSTTPPNDSVQGVRYMWLLLAMHVAEDEGIEIEVSA